MDRRKVTSTVGLPQPATQSDWRMSTTRCARRGDAALCETHRCGAFTALFEGALDGRRLVAMTPLPTAHRQPRSPGPRPARTGRTGMPTPSASASARSRRLEWCSAGSHGQVTLMGPKSGIHVEPGLPWATCDVRVDDRASVHERLARLGAHPTRRAGRRGRAACSSPRQTPTAIRSSSPTADPSALHPADPEFGRSGLRTVPHAYRSVPRAATPESPRRPSSGSAKATPTLATCRAGGAQWTR